MSLAIVSLAVRLAFNTMMNTSHTLRPGTTFTLDSRVKSTSESSKISSNVSITSSSWYNFSNEYLTTSSSFSPSTCRVELDRSVPEEKSFFWANLFIQSDNNCVGRIKHLKMNDIIIISLSYLICHLKRRWYTIHFFLLFQWSVLWFSPSCHHLVSIREGGKNTSTER